MDFASAVELLCRERGAVVSGPQTAMSLQTPTKPFRLTEAYRCGTARVSYLQDRGIDADIICRCIGLGWLYESRRYRNCVFIGRDLEGKVRYASLRGTRGEFKLDLGGSDKRYSFYLPAADPDSSYVAVAESTVDVFSHAMLLKMQGEDWTGNHYLSLGGIASVHCLAFCMTIRMLPM